MNHTKRINYDDVVTELMKGLDYHPHGHFTNSDVEWLKELRTIGFQTTRQSGTSTWAEAFFLKHQEEALLILRSELQANYFNETYRPLPGRVVSQGYMNFIASVAKRSDGHLPTPDPEALEASAIITPLKYVIVDDCHMQYLSTPLYTWLAFEKFSEDLVVFVVR